MRTYALNSFTMFLGLFAILLVSPSFITPDLAGRWEKLGERNVDRTVDQDIITVTRKEGTFKAIKLRVEHSAINMHRVVIHFGNGGKQEVEIRNVIPAGGESRVIDIVGKDRVINRVVFWYDTKGGPLNDKASVELWGKN